MLIQGTLMHSPGMTTAGFLRGVAANAPAHYFIVDPPPGIVMSAAVDWRIVLPCSSAVPLVAEALWDAYESLLSSLPHRDPSPSLLVQCRNSRGQLDQFTIGRDVTERQEGIRRMESAYRLLVGKKPSDEALSLLKDTEDSGFWEQFMP